MKTEEYDVVPFPRERRLVTDIGRMAHDKHVIRGLIEMDVTRPRQLIRDHKERTGEALSFTAFLTACVGRAVDGDKTLHAYRDWLGRLVLYEEVDIATMVEVEKGGKRFPVGHIVRAANKKTFREIHDEIRAVQTRPTERQEIRVLSYVTMLPGFVRRLLLRLLDQSPRLIKQLKGTVILSAVGMFGSGGGWGLSLPSHTLGITVGGIAAKPGIVEGGIEHREYLSVTLDFDHDIVDGAPAARFAQKLRDLVESGYGIRKSKEKRMNPTSATRKAETFHVSPVGYVRRKNGRTVLDILPAFVPALKELENFGHVQVFWWFSQFEDDVHRQTTQFSDAPFDAPVLGVFACRAPTRPNPIGLTTAKVLHVDHGEGYVEIADIDAFDGTPILDLKGYLPVCDRVQNVRVPDWASDWPQWLPEDGLGLED